MIGDMIHGHIGAEQIRMSFVAYLKDMGFRLMTRF